METTGIANITDTSNDTTGETETTAQAENTTASVIYSSIHDVLSDVLANVFAENMQINTTNEDVFAATIIQCHDTWETEKMEIFFCVKNFFSQYITRMLVESSMERFNDYYEHLLKDMLAACFHKAIQQNNAVVNDINKLQTYLDACFISFKFDELYTQVNEQDLSLRNNKQEVERLSTMCDSMVVNINNANTTLQNQINAANTALQKQIDDANDELKEQTNKLSETSVTILGMFTGIVLTVVAGLFYSSSVLENISNVNFYILMSAAALVGLVCMHLISAMFRFIVRIGGHDTNSQVANNQVINNQTTNNQTLNSQGSSSQDNRFNRFLKSTDTPLLVVSVLLFLVMVFGFVTHYIFGVQETNVNSNSDLNVNLTVDTQAYETSVSTIETEVSVTEATEMKTEVSETTVSSTKTEVVTETTVSTTTE